MTRLSTTQLQESPETAWHSLDARAGSSGLGIHLYQGLTAAEAASRLEAYGPNTLQTVNKAFWCGRLSRPLGEAQR